MKDTPVFTVQKPQPQLAHTVDEALDIIGVGRFHYYVYLSCGIFLMATVIETLGVGYILAPAMCELELDTFRKGLLSSITFFGIAITSHVAGFLTDEFGRKRTVIISMIICIIFSALAALGPSFWVIFVFRLLSGMTISAASTGIYAYISEFFPVRLRGSAIAFASVIASMCIFYMATIGIYINRYNVQIPITDSYTISSWRIHMLLNLVPGIISLFLVKSLPESPKYLMLVDKKEECLIVLRKMYEKNSRSSRFNFPVKELKFSSGDEKGCIREASKSMKDVLSSMIHETKEILTPPHLWPLAACCFIQFGSFVLGGGFGIWFPELANRLSKGQSDLGVCEVIGSTSNRMLANQTDFDVTSCNVTVNEEMFTYNYFLAAAYTISFTILGFTLHSISLKRTLALVLALACSCAIAILYITNAVVTVVIFALLINLAGLGVPLVNSVAVDLFPTQLRGMAISVTVLIGRMGTVTGANAIGFILDMNCEATFYGLAAMLVACAITSACLPNRKRDREELQSVTQQ